MSNNQDVKPGQKLEEMWRISYDKMRYDSPIVARLDSWPHTTYYTCRGQGATVEEARLELITMLARAIHEDPDPFGNLGKVIHAATVIEFLNKLVDEDDDYYLQTNVQHELPDRWKGVVNEIITMFQSYMDFWPDEETISSEDVKGLEPDPGDE